MSALPDLLDCPFCGAEPVAYNYVAEAAVVCPECRAKIIRAHKRVGDTGLPEAIKAWNRRA